MNEEHLLFKHCANSTQKSCGVNTYNVNMISGLHCCASTKLLREELTIAQSVLDPILESIKDIQKD